MTATGLSVEQIVNIAINNMGALQKPGELAGLCDVLLLADPAPKVIVEIGSDAGGTLYVWRSLWPDAWVYSVSLQSGPFSSGRPLELHGADLIDGNSQDEETFMRLYDALPFDVPNGDDRRPIDLLFVDGDHTREGCWADVHAYGPLVGHGGILVLHDICHHDDPTVGVEHVWAELDADVWTKACEIIQPPYDWGGLGVAVKK